MGAANPTAASVDVVIVTWNKFELSLDCIEHALKSTVPVNVIVVDNASADETVDRIRKRFPEVKVIELEQNIGFGPAFNRGLKECTSEFVGVLNSDANVEPDFIERALGPFKDESVAVVGGVALNPKDDSIDSAGGMIDRGLGWFQFLSGEPLESLDVDDPRLVGPCWVAAVARTAALQEAGGFDEEIFAYWEDVDLTLRLLAAGHRMAIEPAARAWHIGSATLGTRTSGQLRFAAWGRGYIAGRYRIGPIWLLLELLIGMIDCLRLREFGPLSNRLRGWRRGRSLERRPRPVSMHYISFRESLETRFRWFAG